MINQCGFVSVGTLRRALVQSSPAPIAWSYHGARQRAVVDSVVVDSIRNTIDHVEMVRINDDIEVIVGLDT